MPYYRSKEGLKLHYHEHGRGQPLILLHGFGQDSSGWVDVLPEYARFFRVFAVDMRGAGLSDVPEPGYTMKDIAADIVSLMDHLGEEKVHFAGWSMGGAVGQELGIEHSRRLKSISMHSTWPGGRVPNQTRWIEMRARIIGTGDQVLNVSSRVVNFFSPEFVNAHEERVESFIQRELKNPHPITPKGAMGHAGAVHDARDRLHLISAPTLITVGSLDRTTIPDQSRYLHQRIKGSELVLIEGGGHFTLYQSTKEFVSITLGFLIKHS
jgi:pimeloyl-ACP methyl ester carboxylesterase